MSVPNGGNLQVQPAPAHEVRPADDSLRSRLTALATRERSVEWLRAFDNDPRVIGVGFAIGAVLVVLMAQDLDGQVEWIGRLLLPISVAAPTVGVSVIATLALMREPIGLPPLGFSASIIAACALGALGRMVLAGLAAQRVRIRAEFLAIAAYVGLSVFQFVWILHKVSPVREQFARSTLVQMVSGLGLVIVVAVLFSTRGRRYLLVALVPGVVLAAATALLSLNPGVVAGLPIQGLLPTADVSARGTGVFYNPNYLGAAMAIAILVVGRAARMQLPGVGRFAAPLALLAAAALLASFSRGALVAVVAGLAALYARRGRRPLIAAAVVGVIVITVGYELLLAARHLLTFGADNGASDAAQAASDASRLAVYQAGIQMFLKHPAFGVGYAQFHYESIQYVGSTVITYPHNIFLGVAVEQGLPGILLFVLLIGAVGYALVRAGDEVAVTAAAMFVAFLVGGLFADSLTVLQATTILWIGLGAALVSLDGPTRVAASWGSEERPPPLGWAPR